MHLHPAEALVSAVRSSDRVVAFLIGSPASVDVDGGVPGVAAMVEMVRDEVGTVAGYRLDAFDQELRGHTGAEAYQRAMRWLQGNVGQPAVNRVVQRATLKACLDPKPLIRGGLTGDGEPYQWHLPQATRSLVDLVRSGDSRFLGPILTTNFDPLLSLAVRATGGHPTRSILDSDGVLPRDAEADPEFTRIIHLHGYWRGSDTLHTPVQLGTTRPRLKASLRSLLRSHSLIVVAYGGWDDVFTAALADLVLERDSETDVLWCFYETDPAQVEARYGKLLQSVESALGRGVFRMYGGIDCHTVFGLIADTGTPGSAAEPEPPHPERRRVLAATVPDQTGILDPPSFADLLPRPRAMAALKALIGSQPIVAVEGLSGSGKTYLASSLANDPGSGYAAVLWHQPEAGESVDGLLAAVSSITPLAGASPTGKCRNLLHWLQAAGGLLVIDDFHCVDQASYSVLLELASGSGVPARLLLLSTKFTDVSLKARVDHLAVSGFLRDEVRSLLRGRGMKGLDQDWVEKLIRRTDGLPQAVSFFATLAVQLGFTPQQLLAGRLVRDHLMQDWFAKIVSSAGEEAKRLLSALSLSEGSFNRGMLLALARSEHVNEPEDVLESLLRTFLVQRYREYSWRVHPLVASFSTRGMTEGDARRVHLALARYFGAGLPDGKGRVLDASDLRYKVRACRHFQKAAEFRGSERLIHEIAKTAKAYGAFELLSGLCRIELRSNPDRDRWIDYHHAHCLLIRGRLLDAFASLEPLHRSLDRTASNLALAITRLFAETLYGLGRPAEALQVLRNKLDGVAGSAISRVVWAQARAFEAHVRIELLDFTGALGIAEELLATAARREDKLGSAVALTLWGIIELKQGRPDADKLQGALELFQECRDRRGEAWALSHIACSRLAVGSHDAGEAALRESLAIRADIAECSAEYLDYLEAVREQVRSQRLKRRVVGEMLRVKNGLQRGETATVEGSRS
jgi:hypothetical protein